MTAFTLMNVASSTKPVTATAVMQLVERGKLLLDADVSRYLPFRLRHPLFPSVRITLRQLLTHTAAIADGPAYEDSYHCGEIDTPLAAWLRAYLLSGGRQLAPQTTSRPGRLVRNTATAMSRSACSDSWWRRFRAFLTSGISGNAFSSRWA